MRVNLLFGFSWGGGTFMSNFDFLILIDGSFYFHLGDGFSWGFSRGEKFFNLFFLGDG